MASLCDDQVSISSSCEIVDALTEASEDLPTRVDVTKNEAKECSPAIENVWAKERSDAFPESMTTSQYAQVIFSEIADSYPIDLDLVCRYTLTPGVEAGHGDRVALYKLPYLQPHEYVAYVWTKMQSEQELDVTFPVSVLPKEEDFYQFQYLQGDNKVAGASVPFQLRAPGKCNQEVCGVREEGDLLVVQTPHTSLQEKVADIENKYTGLLELSEQLTDELNMKNQSFVVLEQQHMSLLENVSRCQQLEGDLQTLVGEKLQLEQTLTQTTETLGQAERVLNTTTTRLEEVERALHVKTDEVANLEANLASSETKCGSMAAELGVVAEERERLANMLDQEIKAREMLLKEKMELVDRLEDTNNMLNAAAKSKDLAIEEIRAQIQQQDKLRQELATAREEAGNAEAELVLVKQELSKHTDKEDDSNSFVVASVMSSLGAKLEEKEREVMQKDKELALLRQVESNLSSMEIHEKCLEDADKRAANFEKENRDIVEENVALKQKVSQLEKEKQELVKRLEAGAAHYRKLAAEKSTWEKAKLATGPSSPVSDKYTLQIDSLENKIVQLSEELRHARMSQDMQLSQISRAVSHASSMTLDRDDMASMDSISDTSNMDSIRINNAVTTSQEGPVVKMPSLFHPFPPTSENTQNAVPDPSLPAPLLPENIDPTVLIPELTPRTPAPYSSGSSSEQSGEYYEDATANSYEAAKLECPICDTTFPLGSAELLQNHVGQHLDNLVECPVCGKTYDKKNQMEYEEHVQEHFKEQVVEDRELPFNLPGITGMVQSFFG
eukprot:GFUD01001424.1.p1 GENE.GFUD01001424.1~~GFUD01001424.1.p1  ORF type:complete len:785 (-),score=233.53 GFUD01001424.1:792-3146(-)